MPEAEEGSSIVGWYIEIDNGSPYATRLSSLGWLRLTVEQGVEVLTWNELPHSLKTWLQSRGELRRILS